MNGIPGLSRRERKRKARVTMSSTPAQRPQHTTYQKPISEETPLTLCAAIDRLNATERGFSFLNPDPSDETKKETYYSFADMRTEIRRRAGLLLARGVVPGDHVAVIVPAPEDFVLSFLALVYMGAIPVPMYPPLSLGKLDAYLEGACKVMTAGRARWLLTTKQVEPILWSTLGKVPTVRDLLLCDTMFAPGESAGLPQPATPPMSEVVFLQFTSGSTSDPKGVRVTHASLFNNTKTLLTAIEADGTKDNGVSWLPLYHDMGLIGFVLGPMMYQIPTTFIPTMRFIKRPLLWLDVMHEKKASITFAPNFAFALLSKRVTKEQAARWDLSNLKVAGCGAEPIQAETMHTFAETFAASGFQKTSLLPCYGMAEATLAISFKRMRENVRTDRISKDAYENDKVAVPTETENALTVVSCGTPLPGYQIKIVDDRGTELSERKVGEVCIKGGLVTDGYHLRPDATKQSFKDGWLHSGDLGYMASGELYICGRKKDLIILNGRNYYPQTLEWSIENVDSVRKGNVVAFSVPSEGSEALVVAVESKATDKQALQTKIKQLLGEQFALSVKEVVVLPPGTLPKTSSGKLQRQRTRQLYLNRELNGSEVRTFGSRAKKFELAQHLVRSYRVKWQRKIASLLSLDLG